MLASGEVPAPPRVSAALLRLVYMVLASASSLEVHVQLASEVKARLGVTPRPLSGLEAASATGSAPASGPGAVTQSLRRARARAVAP